jgi:hypothetical protein
MNAPFSSARAERDDAAWSDDLAGSVAGRWTAIHEAGGAVAALAGRALGAAGDEIHSFPALIREAGEWRREEAEKGVSDMAAMMEAGLSALLAVNSRGADPGPAAEALWREFEDARNSILALLPPSGEPER